VCCDIYLISGAFFVPLGASDNRKELLEVEINLVRMDKIP
jgi:hypothetical protein